MVHPLTLKENLTRNSLNKQELHNVKEEFKSLHSCLTSVEKHFKAHSSLVECFEFVLKRPTFAEAAENIFGRCKVILGAQAGFVALVDNSGKHLEVLHLDSGGLETQLQYDKPLPIRGFRKQCLQKRITLHCNNFQLSKWSKLLPKKHIILKNVLLAPLVIEETSVGLLGFANKLVDFDDDDLRIASSFAKLTALTLSSSKAWLLLKNYLTKQ